MPLFQVSFKAGKAVYLQLVDQVKAAIGSGALRTGDPLPSIRPLAEELRVNRNTVAKAYTELERQGIIETAPGKGCFVSGRMSPLRRDARRRLLADVLDEVAVQAHHLQIDRDEFLRIARERFDILEDKRTRATTRGTA